MPILDRIPRGLEWLREAGLSEGEMRSLTPAIPGEFTLFDTYYVNSGSPKVVYRGTGEGTLPMVAGRWYIISSDVAERYASLTRDPQPLAAAARLAR